MLSFYKTQLYLFKQDFLQTFHTVKRRNYFCFGFLISLQRNVICQRQLCISFFHENLVHLKTIRYNALKKIKFLCYLTICTI